MFKQYINGKLVDGLGKRADVINPADGNVIDSLYLATKEQAEEALEAAARAFKTWSKTPVNERISWMLKLREACINEREKLIELVSAESGRPYPAAAGDVDWFITSCGFYSDEVKRVLGMSFPVLDKAPGASLHLVERQPIGVVVGHVAWNYPLGNASIKLCPSVVSGCACIIKPSSQTPLATLYIGELAAKIGFPAGVINIISGPSGEVAKTLNSSSIPKMITLIGSSETGLQVMREAATSVKKFSFELGGNAPVVVMDDVDVDQVAANIIAKKVTFAGQTCVNYNRIYVHEKVYSKLVDAVEEQLKQIVPGKWKDPGYIICPMIDKKARDRMIELIDDAVAAGAKLVSGGNIPEGYEAGSYIMPALLKDVTDDMRVSKEEIFGPIIPIQPFSELNEALEKANNTIYGLSAYFFGHRAPDIAKACQAFEAGEIFVNGAGGNEFVPHSGVKQSGIGCDKSFWSLEEYFDFKYLSVIP